MVSTDAGPFRNIACEWPVSRNHWQAFAAAENDGHLIGLYATGRNSKVLNGLVAVIRRIHVKGERAIRVSGQLGLMGASKWVWQTAQNPMSPGHTIRDVSKTTVYEQPAVDRLGQVKQFEDAHPMTALRTKRTFDFGRGPGTTAVLSLTTLHLIYRGAAKKAAVRARHSEIGCRNHRIAEHWGVFDEAGMAAQLGL